MACFQKFRQHLRRPIWRHTKPPSAAITSLSIAFHLRVSDLNSEGITDLHELIFGKKYTQNTIGVQNAVLVTTNEDRVGWASRGFL